MNFYDLFNLQEVGPWISAHKVGSVVIAGIALYIIGGLILVLQRRYGFYIWYFVVIAFVSLGIGVTSLRLYSYTFLLGMVTAFAEVISKFRDEPLKALKMPHALLYHILNGAIAAFALKILILFSTDPIANPQQQLKAVVISGLGSMLIMRSKLFNIKVAGEDVSFGPEQIINIYFRFMEAAIDRLRARDRIEFVKSTLGNINPVKVFDYAVTMLLASQALDDKARKECIDGVNALKDGEFKDLSPNLRSYRLGFLLLDNMGENFVTTAFENAPTDWLLEAPVQESYQQPTFVDKVAKKIFPSSDSQEAPILYMAYGSSMSSRHFRARLGSQWKEMSETKFREVTKPRKCVLAGYAFAFNGYRPATNGDENKAEQFGLANIRKTAPEDTVEGVLFELVKEVVDFLDGTESGYHREKVTVTVEGDSGKTEQVQAEAYFANAVRDDAAPDARYMQAVLDGATEFQLSESYRQKLQQAAEGVVAVGK